MPLLPIIEEAVLCFFVFVFRNIITKARIHIYRSKIILSTRKRAPSGQVWVSSGGFLAGAGGDLMDGWNVGRAFGFGWSW